MTAIGYLLSGEEHGPDTLVRNASRAEEAGFGLAIVSDHIHPWSNAQGHSPFVWTVLGAMAQSTSTLTLGTGVTCPTVRIHPAIVAHAAATVATMLPDRFFLGVGSGENLNEHVLGDYWPRPPVRLEMLEEAIEVIHRLWEGKQWSHDGLHYTVDDLRIFDLPERTPPIICSATGPVAARVAATADGVIVPSLSPEVLDAWRDAGGRGPTLAMFHMVYADSEDAARTILSERWPHTPLGGGLGLELRTPGEFDEASRFIRPEDYDKSEIPLGPDPAPVLEKIEEFAAAGFEHVIIHNIGEDQEPFFRFFENELAPSISIDPPTVVTGARTAVAGTRA